MYLHLSTAAHQQPRCSALIKLALLFTLTCALPVAAQPSVVTAWNVVASSVTGNWRAPTIAHLAVHDALNAIDRRFEPYAVDAWAPPNTSPEAAIAAAAHRVLIRLVPSAAAVLDAAYAESLAAISPA
jgi:hypothetical protein